MIYITTPIYGKCWKITTKSEKYIDIQMSTSEKGETDGEYINSRWFPRLVGHAFNSLKDKIKEGDLITITKAKLTNAPYPDKDGNKRNLFKFLVYEASIKGDNSEQTATEAVENNNDTEQPW